MSTAEDSLEGVIRAPAGRFVEEERSRQPSVFSLLRALGALFHHADEPHLGLYGAFGYDLAFQFEPIRLRLERPPDQRDLLLYLPDELVIVDHRRELATVRRYEFEVGGRSTGGPAANREHGAVRRDHERAAAGATTRPGSTRPWSVWRASRSRAAICSRSSRARPSARRARCRRRSSSAGCASAIRRRTAFSSTSARRSISWAPRPRCTCGSTATAWRRARSRGPSRAGSDPIGDASQIVALLTSGKDESELTMCTDVDRNDKSRICVPGSVRVIGRRQIEMYARLIHTVDHVEGRLRPEFDALDAFLAHAWAVTVTGAPKAWAMQFIEDHERSSRAWYGGAVGVMGFDGNLNTGLTLRTIRVKHGIAEVRAGATLLYDSDPDAEEAETELKASVFLDTIRRGRTAQARAASGDARRARAGGCSSSITRTRSCTRSPTT